ncbi:MAG TPA: hypothetical protein ENJ28_08325 [Gammaproteobacteria bacterium]|nr:hypothetical protein [Gammaproteobacteria bacterium]
MCKMNKAFIEKLKSDYPGTDYELAISEMESITLKHVMANSQTNLDNVLSAILQLSKGDLNERKYSQLGVSTFRG